VKFVTELTNVTYLKKKL